MKKIIYTLVATTLLFASCKSIDKMIDKGQYEEAFRFGVDKLQGEKNKKTKYVKGLEKAFAQLNRQDNKQIRMLVNKNSRRSFDQIVDIYQKMDRRQEYLIPLLPLFSEDGYLAEIKITDYSDHIATASSNAAEAHYKRATAHLEVARKDNNRGEAIAAFNAFDDVLYYYTNYKDVQSLKREAYTLGQKHILVESYTHGSNPIYDHTKSIIDGVSVARLNTTWRKFYAQEIPGVEITHIATIEISDIEPGRERERYNEYTETAEIVEGQIPVKDLKGNVVKDTSGNIIYTDKIRVVQAHVLEVIREKEAHMSGKIVIIDALNGSLRSTVPINVTHIFDDYSCTYRGDKRALSSQTKRRLKPNCNPFPSDYDITTELAYAYKAAAEETIRSERY